MKIKPCTLGPRHKWTWVKNIIKTTQSGRSFRMSVKGRYQCECGATKIGELNHNEQSPLNNVLFGSQPAEAGGCNG